MNIPFEITSGGAQTYRIRNVSDETLDLVTATVDHPEGLTRNLPKRETFDPGSSREFMVADGSPNGGEGLLGCAPDSLCDPLPPKD